MKMFCITHLPIAGLESTGAIPVFVGQGNCPSGWLRDDSGDNIHEKNATFCELTAQYWVWKNLLNTMSPTEIIGFCHYRRHFVSPESSLLNCEGLPVIYNADTLNELYRYFLGSKAEIMLPCADQLNEISLKRRVSFLLLQLKRRRRLYWNRTIYTHYNSHLNGEDILAAATLLGAEYEQEFLQYIQHCTTVNLCNMYIGSVSHLSKYFSTLFPWLFECEKKIPADMGDPYQKRVYGFLAERFSSFYFSRVHTVTEVPIVALQWYPGYPGDNWGYVLSKTIELRPTRLAAKV